MFRDDGMRAPAATAFGEVEVLSEIRQVPARAWDALAGDDDPFVRHAFLGALEQSGAVSAETGWLPSHLVLREGETLIGAMPLYLKGHSFGEYIFDWGWAEAALAAGLTYYPKLVSAIPFTPAGAGRILVHPEMPREAIARRLLAGARELAERVDASSVHLLFVDGAETLFAEREGYLPRLTYQFHWDDAGYESFDGYLARLRSPVRKQIRKERRRAVASGLELLTLDGGALRESHWRALYAFYRDTCDRKWGQAYLDQAFFEQIRATLAGDVVATLALDGGRPVAGALFFQRGRSLYGRYWGATTDADALHFELCYYRPIELCIQRGYTHFEAGAQGAHKLKRGLLPAPTHSAHWFCHSAFAAAVGRALKQERRAVQREMAFLTEHGPFRRD